MNNLLDVDGNELKPGDVIDINQTVNGQNMFFVMSVEPLDIRYAHDFRETYQYDQLDLLSPSRFTGEVDWKIITNIYRYLNMVYR